MENQNGNDISTKERIINTSMKTLGFVYIPLFIFLLLAPPLSLLLLFPQEFFKKVEGNVIKVERIHGGDDLTLDNGSTFYWIIRPDPPLVGEKLHKEKYSFRYMVNGRNAMDRNQAMILIMKMPPKYMFPCLVFMIVFQFLYYKRYGEFVPDMICTKEYKFNKKQTLCFLAVIPVVAVYYTILYIAMGFWV